MFSFQVSKRKTVADPINLVWATKGLSSNDQQLRGLRFPVDEESSQRFEELVKRMEPATFGRGAKDVLDPSYRKAVKLDTDDFVSSFSPYDYGIIDEVAQLLLPSMHISDLHLRGVRAELYKLNVSDFGRSFFGHFLTNLGLLWAIWSLQSPCRHSALCEPIRIARRLPPLQA